MRKIGGVVIILFMAFSLKAQLTLETKSSMLGVGNTISETIYLKGDTLFIPPGKCKFLKVGDKVYKLVTTVEEVKPEQNLFPPWGGTFTPNNGIYLDNTLWNSPFDSLLISKQNLK